jgi:hypothetical protein
MDKDDLTILLSSGKFLCFKPSTLAQAYKAPAQPEGTDPGTGSENGPPLALFDLDLLQKSIFFKETGLTDEGDLATSTRVMLSFDENDALQGGVSSAAHPDLLIPALNKWYGGQGQIDLTPHDHAVLDCLCRVPTFDPFILLSYRETLESHRKVHPAYYDVDRVTSDGVKKVIDRRASRLVKLALGEEEEMDVPQDPAVETQAEGDTLISRQRSISRSLVDAIWTSRVDDQTRSLLQSFRIADGDMRRVLFAWKGISYYEYIFNGLMRDHQDFFRWLGSSESQPRDGHQIDPGRLKDLAARRTKSIKAIRQSYVRCAGLLSRYEDAYGALTTDNNPKPFQGFLMAAPKLFTKLGVDIGRFGHASNGWAEMTNKGRRYRVSYDRLDVFYDFVLSLHQGS